MKFKEIIDQQVTHQQLHIGEVLGLEDYHILSCNNCYPVKDQPKPAKFDKFWRII